MENLDKKSAAISSMFNRIAPRYDLLNHLLSLNMDKYWRKKLADFLLGRNVSNVLDLACGTGDSTIGIYKKGLEVTGADIAEKMVEIARAKNKKLKRRKKREYAPQAREGEDISGGTGTSAVVPKQRGKDKEFPRETLPLPVYRIGSAESLPFPDGSFDAVTISFGIRNFDKREQCLDEIYRVIKPGGCLAVLEFAKPRNKIIKEAYDLYFNNLLPFIGKILSKDKNAYKYLAESVEQFPRYEDFCKEIESAGFRKVKYRKYTFGIAVLYTGIKN